MAVKAYCKGNRNIEAVSICRKPFLSEVRNFRDSAADIYVYEVDGSFQEFFKPEMLAGRFIWDRDASGLNRYAVIDRKTAVKLFGTADCIGSDITVGAREHKILGIIKPEDSLLGFMASVHKAAVYVPLSSGDSIYAEYL
jgi:ABC-type antimicrobial peptide transport system permease subunit